MSDSVSMFVCILEEEYLPKNMTGNRQSSGVSVLLFVFGFLTVFLLHLQHQEFNISVH